MDAAYGSAIRPLPFFPYIPLFLQGFLHQLTLSVLGVS
jgi:hypothetical protein